MHIKDFKARLRRAKEEDVDELCLVWLLDFAQECHKDNIYVLLTYVADQLGVDIATKGESK